MVSSAAARGTGAMLAGLPAGRGADLLGLGQARQIDLHRRAVALLAVDAHMAAGLLDEAMHHGEAEARAFARRAWW